VVSCVWGWWPTRSPIQSFPSSSVSAFARRLALSSHRRSARSAIDERTKPRPPHRGRVRRSQYSTLSGRHRPFQRCIGNWERPTRLNGFTCKLLTLMPLVLLSVGGRLVSNPAVFGTVPCLYCPRRFQVMESYHRGHNKPTHPPPRV